MPEHSPAVVGPERFLEIAVKLREFLGVPFALLFLVAIQCFA